MSEMITQELQTECYETARKNGFLKGDINHKREHLLICSEAIECMQNIRDGRRFDWVSNGEGCIPECADIILRISSYLHHMGAKITPTGKPYDLEGMDVYSMLHEVVRLVSRAGGVAPHRGGHCLLSDAVDLVERWLYVRQLDVMLFECLVAKMEKNKQRGHLHGRAF
jgi:hypothetical protein